MSFYCALKFIFEQCDCPKSHRGDLMVATGIPNSQTVCKCIFRNLFLNVATKLWVNDRKKLMHWASMTTRASAWSTRWFTTLREPPTGAASFFYFFFFVKKNCTDRSTDGNLMGQSPCRRINFHPLRNSKRRPVDGNRLKGEKRKSSKTPPIGPWRSLLICLHRFGFLRFFGLFSIPHFEIPPRSNESGAGGSGTWLIAATWRPPVARTSRARCTTAAAALGPQRVNRLIRCDFGTGSQVSLSIASLAFFSSAHFALFSFILIRTPQKRILNSMRTLWSDFR